MYSNIEWPPKKVSWFVKGSWVCSLSTRFSHVAPNLWDRINGTTPRERRNFPSLPSTTLDRTKRSVTLAFKSNHVRPLRSTAVAEIIERRFGLEADERSGAECIVQRRPKCSGAQPSSRRKCGAVGSPTFRSVTSASKMERIDHRRRVSGPARGRDAKWHERWSRLADRIED